MISIARSGLIYRGWVWASLLLLLPLTVQATPVEANTATHPELESIKGIGPRMALHISTERRSGNFRDWTDLIERVQGIGQSSALKFSNHGLTVNGAPYSPSPSTSSTSGKPHHSVLSSGRGVIMTIPQVAALPPQATPVARNTVPGQGAPRPARISQPQ